MPIHTEEKDVDPGAPNCLLCGRPMRKIFGPYGEFWGCRGYPMCAGKRPIDLESEYDEQDDSENPLNWILN